MVGKGRSSADRRVLQEESALGDLHKRDTTHCGSNAKCKELVFGPLVGVGKWQQLIWHSCFCR